MSLKNKTDIWLREQISHGRSYTSIGKECGCSRQAVEFRCRHLGLKSKFNRRKVERKKIIINLHKKGLLVQEIADYLSLKRGNVYHILFDEGLSANTAYQKLRDKDWLYKKYIVQGFSTKKIAKMLGCSTYQMITRWLRVHGIPVKPKGRY